MGGSLPRRPYWSRLPRAVLINLCSYLALKDLRSCSLVCKSWYQLLNEEDTDVWRFHCMRRLAEEALHSDLLDSLPTYKARLRAFFHAWNPADCSRNVYIKTDGFTLHRNPVAQSTDAARGKIGFRQGRHCWEVWWSGPLGTVAVIGLATRAAELHAPGYVALLGADGESWGWNLVDSHLLHNGDSQGNYPSASSAGVSSGANSGSTSNSNRNCLSRYRTGERIRVILDCDDNTLCFERGSDFLGVAFTDLPRTMLYPAVSAVYGNTEVSMVYLGQPLDG